MTLKFCSITGPGYCGIAPGLGKFARYLLVEQLESIDFVNRSLGRVCAVIDNESLSSRSEILLGDDIDYGAIFCEDST